MTALGLNASPPGLELADIHHEDVVLAREMSSGVSD
jgi:hypothetical protein